jgi:hypothetical protein
MKDLHTGYYFKDAMKFQLSSKIIFREVVHKYLKQLYLCWKKSVCAKGQYLEGRYV